ncbi:Myb-like DNA-binding domain containing protein [Trichomonas vaginalis G3]|uniref:Myb-like DNA-binding domain containing protein n=1 Tax=Trichomonas vaginalis (strain ATCC PRA-98 / G3) TaxID=412133 RepID=A2DXS7_TRIV3|nr:RNA polymerase II transcription regulator recruiting protein [Trichomonas vaginalis G3]EAY14787.1 Myb-like DNA-binding domain containing protein [Trichomonas vaginalis G3]KAI5508062.1 RNA polymerase II transcription regulator recruiting protein [Trichomonas vaginalis G3]|eukprot:XP_001327010.1 Myb-like DNA-binding domain containing protein [Trichomonas vaginalis G3]
MADDRNWVGIKRRRLFSPQDDRRLEQIIREGNFQGWKNVALAMPGFTAKQLRDRWHNYLSPRNSLAPWSLAEDIIIVHKIKEIGTKWSQISTYLRGRSSNCIKNRWNSVLKEDSTLNPSKYLLESQQKEEETPPEPQEMGDDPPKQIQEQPVKNGFTLDQRFIDRFFDNPPNKSK